MLAYDDTDVISGLPRLEDLSDPPEGVLSEIIADILDRKSADEPQALFQSGISP